MTEPTMTAEEFDEYFDNGGDTTPFIKAGTIRRPGREEEARKVNLTMPEWLIAELDAEAKHLASTRQAVVNTRLADYYEAKRNRASA